METFKIQLSNYNVMPPIPYAFCGTTNLTPNSSHLLTNIVLGAGNIIHKVQMADTISNTVGVVLWCGYKNILSLVDSSSSQTLPWVFTNQVETIVQL